MAAKIDPDFKYEILKYGAHDFKECYNCGNCTAVCNLTDEESNFPRILIRNGLLGLKNEILESKELWMCYGCGDCSESCPKGANPAAYMAALRRFAIGQYDISGLARLLFKGKIYSIVITILLSVILGFFLITLKTDTQISRWLFNFIPYSIIHNMGIVIFIITGISIITGILKMGFHLNQPEHNKKGNTTGNFLKALSFTFSEIGLMNRHRTCDSGNDSKWKNKPSFLKPWFIHFSIMWGFFGLLIATILDFIFKDPAIEIWLPARILGTIAGLSLMFGTSISIFYRIKKITKFYGNTVFADWIFLFFLWLAGFTGFWLEISVTFSISNLLSQIIFLIHIVISMELVLLFIFSKFAHTLFRPMALFFYKYL